MKTLLTAALLLLTACNSPLGRVACGGLWCGGATTALDQIRYKPDGKARDDAYEACLFATAGKGREPFDACMSEKGFTR